MEPASFETGASSSSPARHDGAKAATGPHHGTSVDVVSPPYWKQQHQRNSYLSTYSADGHPTPISLEDHTDEGSEHCKVLWAKGVTIDDYVVVSGSAPGLGAYVVWNCTVETLDVSSGRMTLVLQAAANHLIEICFVDMASCRGPVLHAANVQLGWRPHKQC